MRGFLLGASCAFLLAAGLSHQALAQSKTRIWDIKFGTPVSALPVQDFVNPACGTNGGPQSLRLKSFGDFARCPAEAGTGLHEVWFIYDDEWEYIARAHRDEQEVGQYSANTFYSQPIITSLLIDNAGTVQGYRVVTDPRAPDDIRTDAYQLGGIFKTTFAASDWTCTDLPHEDGEQPLGGVFVKQVCTSMNQDRLVKVEIHHRYKPGQDLTTNPRDIQEAQGDFESFARLEAFNRNAVKDEPCCQAFVHP
jgi:hypothetical protein